MAIFQVKSDAKSLGVKVYGMTSEEGRGVFEYVDGERTDTQRKSEKTGEYLFRHPVLVKLPGERPFETQMVLDSEEGLGELVEVKLTPDTEVSIRASQSGFGVDVNLSGSVLSSSSQQKQA